MLLQELARRAVHVRRVFCGLTEEAFSALPLPEVEYLLDERYAPPPKTEKEQKASSAKRQRRRKPKKERETVVIIPKEKG